MIQCYMQASVLVVLSFFFLPIDGALEIFDSLGINEQKEQLYLKYLPYQEIFQANVTPLQRSDSDTCGSFVAFFIVNRFFEAELSFTEFLQIFFNKNTDKNEHSIEHFIKNGSGTI